VGANSSQGTVMTISLIILSFNNFESTTYRCITSLGQPDFDEFTITVVDNKSNDGSREKLISFLLSKNYPKPILSENNLGFSGGMNLGAFHTSGEWIVLINSDTVFFDNSLKQLRSVLLNSKEHIVGFLTNAAGTAQEIIKTNDISEAEKEAAEIHSKSTGLEIPLYRADFFCVAIRRSCWEKLGGLDESFGRGYYEDVDFCLRAKQEGFTIAMSEDVFIGHTGSASFKHDPSQRDLIKRNKNLLLSRHPNALFLHNRDDNLAALKHYITIIADKPVSAAILHRVTLRISRAETNTPKSLIKKVIYIIRLNKIKKVLNKKINSN
jgi:GT2 family glycosyltransferase